MANAFAHVELNTDDLKIAKKFYRSVFDWKLADVPGQGYTMIDVGKGVGGGMQKKPMPQAPAAWIPYVEVDDVKKTLARAQKGGAQIALDFTEIGEMGAIGVFVDPAGATLGLWQSVKKPKKASAKPKPKPKANKSARR